MSNKYKGNHQSMGNHHSMGNHQSMGSQSTGNQSMGSSPTTISLY